MLSRLEYQQVNPAWVSGATRWPRSVTQSPPSRIWRPLTTWLNRPSQVPRWGVPMVMTCATRSKHHRAAQPGAGGQPAHAVGHKHRRAARQHRDTLHRLLDDRGVGVDRAKYGSRFTATKA